MQFSHISDGKNKIRIVDKNGRQLPASEIYVKSVKRIVSIFEDLSLYFIHAVSLHLPIYFIRKEVFKLFGLTIGQGSTIHMGCKFFQPSGVTIGADTKIGDGAFLDGRGKLIIGNHVDFASQVAIYTSEHDINSEDFVAINDSVEIGDYVFVGPRVIILPGVKVGIGAIIGAGAVVTKNVKEFDIVGGIPAKTIGERQNKSPKYVLGRARLFQ